jgi:hypothetical protein
MGSSFTEYQGKGFWARDGDVEMLLFVLAQEADRLNECPSWLKEAKSHWRVRAAAGLNGCIVPNLDRFLATPERAEFVIGLAENGRAWLKDRGPVLSKDFLNSLGLGGPGVFFSGDLDVSVFLPMFAAFIELLRGKVGPDWNRVLGSKPKQDAG